MFCTENNLGAGSSPLKNNLILYGSRLYVEHPPLFANQECTKPSATKEPSYLYFKLAFYFNLRVRSHWTDKIQIERFKIDVGSMQDDSESAFTRSSKTINEL